MSDASESEATAPRERADLVGHETAETLLRQAWDSNRLPHAWLMVGPAGIGKATLAHRFARFVLAQGAPVAAATGDGLFDATDLPAARPPEAGSLALDPAHPVFRQTANGAHPDLLVLAGEEGSGLIPVDQVRQIGRFLRLTPAMGGWRVVIVDGVESMNRNAANALLKILEEPPERALILLVGHAPGRLLATIRSRCRRLTLAPLTDSAVQGLLRHERPDLDDSQVRGLAALAGGSPGRALGLLAAGGLEVHSAITTLLDGLPNLDWAAVHALGDRLSRPGQEAAFDAFSDALLNAVAERARARATRGCGGADLADWLAVWDKTRHSLGPVQPLNLERKQAVISVFGGIAETVARN
ncbi:MAG: DNA polymerase III subunit delta' [Alphaproteobacteria bacterium]